jgi:hypothetical protein
LGLVVETEATYTREGRYDQILLRKVTAEPTAD